MRHLNNGNGTVAYFSAADWNNLPGIEAYPELRNIVISDNVYTSTKGIGKTGAPLAMSPGTPDVGNNVGPTPRPHSRGEHSSSPYGSTAVSNPTLRARQYSFGSSSDVSSSYQPRSPTSTFYDSPASYTYHSPPPVLALPQSQQKQQVFQPHHQHTSSTSSISTGSPPTGPCTLSWIVHQSIPFFYCAPIPRIQKFAWSDFERAL
jgi:hypothetical protein